MQTRIMETAKENEALLRKRGRRTGFVELQKEDKEKRLSWGSWERRSTRKGKNLLKLVSCQHESMQKLDRIGSLTNGERNFWASFPADLAETKGALTCAMICLPELYADAATRDWI